MKVERLLTHPTARQRDTDPSKRKCRTPKKIEGNFLDNVKFCYILNYSGKCDINCTKYFQNALVRTLHI